MACCKSMTHFNSSVQHHTLEDFVINDEDWWRTSFLIFSNTSNTGLRSYCQSCQSNAMMRTNVKKTPDFVPQGKSILAREQRFTSFLINDQFIIEFSIYKTLRKWVWHSVVFAPITKMKTLQNPQKIPNLKPPHSKESMSKTSTGPVGYFTDFIVLKKYAK